MSLSATRALSGAFTSPLRLQRQRSANQRRAGLDLSGAAADAARPGGGALVTVRRGPQPAHAQQSTQQQQPEAEKEFEDLLPEEDQEIPGTYRDAMSSSTPLGKAVKGACDELEALGQLEEQQLREAEALLKSVGWKGSLFGGGDGGAGERSSGSGSAQGANDA